MRGILFLIIAVVNIFFASCSKLEKVHFSGMQQLYQESQNLNQTSLDSTKSFTTQLGMFVKFNLVAIENELYHPLIINNNINLSLAPYGCRLKEIVADVGVKLNAEWLKGAIVENYP